MRRAMPVLALSLLVAACAPTKEQEVTRQVLANAQMARTAVIDLETRYDQMVHAAAGPAAPAAGWEAVAPFRDSAEGVAVKAFLSEYAKPVAVDPTFPRAGEIRELTEATAAYVDLALAPRGTWESFHAEMGGLKSRLDRALAAVEKGTKDFIRIEARTKTEEKSMAYSNALAKARAEGAAKTTEAPAAK